MGAIEYVDERLLALDEVAAKLKCRPDAVGERVAALEHELRETRKALEAATTGAGASKVADAYQAAVQLDGYKAVVARIDGLTGKEMRSAWDGIRDAAGGEPVACVIASATPDGKVALLAGGTDGAVSAGFAAGAIIKDIAGLVGGRGGGPAQHGAGGRLGRLRHRRRARRRARRAGHLVRALALDIGEARVGVAVSDPAGRVASPVCVLPAQEVLAHAASFRRVLEDWEPELLVCGRPMTLAGEEGPQVARVREQAERIAAACGLPLEFEDERLSSAEAKRILREQGLSERAMRGKVDMVAASLFLQSWLDARHN